MNISIHKVIFSAIKLHLSWIFQPAMFDNPIKSRYKFPRRLNPIQSRSNVDSSTSQGLWRQPNAALPALLPGRRFWKVPRSAWELGFHPLNVVSGSFWYDSDTFLACVTASDRESIGKLKAPLFRGFQESWTPEPWSGSMRTFKQWEMNLMSLLDVQTIAHLFSKQ